MTAEQSAGAPSHVPDWHAIDWRAADRNVHRLQARIAQATIAGKRGKVKALQRLLTHSYSAKAVAVRRVTENHGKHTAGVDGVTWDTPQSKAEAVRELGRRRGYHPQPLRRVYIPKKSNPQKKRPLGIPCMFDRAQQALYQLALDPVAETTSDPNSYGFRRERGTADAIGQCFCCLAKTCSPKWILEGDIRACFDEISHEWMTEHVWMDTAMLRKWLTAGYIEQGTFHPTDHGTPQGGVISPVLANLTLNGLERVLREHYPSRTRKGHRAQVNLIRYADDFIITGSSKELLEHEIQPLVAGFLQERGLSLSAEKTVVTHIEDGFDFLGQTVRKYHGKLIITPSKKNYATFIGNIRDTVRHAKAMTPAQLIGQLNPIIRGRANYHRHVCSKRSFEKADRDTFDCVWRWARRKHPHKSSHWVAQKYFLPPKGRRWTLNATVEEQDGTTRTLLLFRASSVPIQRHVKIKGAANPYDPDWEPYFEARACAQAKSNLGWRYDEYRLWQQQGRKCPLCGQDLTEERGWDRHHKVWQVYGGTDDLTNLELLHPNCHRQLHSRATAAFRDGTGSGDAGSGEARAVCDESRPYGS